MSKIIIVIGLLILIVLSSVAYFYLDVDKRMGFNISETQEGDYDNINRLSEIRELPPLVIKNYSKEWIVTKRRGEEIAFDLTLADLKDKKTEICFILREGIDPASVNLSERNLYGKNGSAILDDKNKTLKIKYESNKCDGVDGYHLALTDAKAVNINEYIRFGENSLIIEYQDLNKLNYQSSWFDLNVTLFMNITGNFSSPANDIWVRTDNVTQKFGADIDDNETKHLKYLIESSKEIKQRERGHYYLSQINRVQCGSVFCFNEEFHNLDFSDICHPRMNMTVVNEEDIDGTILFFPNCSFNYLDEFNLEITFLAEYNSSLGYISVDPTITIEDVSSSDSILINVTVENNFTHLTTNGSAINNSDLFFYLPFDSDVSTVTTYDYSEKNNDAALISGATYTDEGIIGKGMEMDGTNDYVNVLGFPEFNNTPRDMVLSAWFFQKGEGRNAHQGVVSVLSPSNNAQLRMGTSANTARYVCNSFYSILGGGTTGLAAIQNVADTKDAWHHIMCKLDFTPPNTMNLTLFVDGTIRASTTVTTFETFEYTADRVQVGSSKLNFNRFFNGTIDEAMMLNNKTLTDAQLLEIWTNSSSRFLPRGEQIFENINVSGVGNENMINITINSTMFLGSMINVSIGEVSGGSYTYGTEATFTNNFINDSTVTGIQNISLKFIFYPGDATTQFYSPTLENNIIIDSYRGGPNVAPNLTLISPENNTFDLNSTVSLVFNVSDNDGDLVNIQIFVTNRTNDTLFHEVHASTVPGDQGRFEYNLSFMPILEGYGIDVYAWYHLDNRSDFGESNSRVFDFSNNGRNGTPVFGTHPNSTGLFSGAYEFSGASQQHISIGLGTAFNDTCNNGCTFAAWVFALDATTGMVVSKSDSNPANHMFEFGTSGADKMELMIWETPTGASCIATGEILPENIWVHVTGVYNGTDTLMYYNGDLQQNTTCSFSGVHEDNWSISQQTIIGAREILSPTYGSVWDGLIDELVILNRSLNGTEVSEFFELKNGKYNWYVNATDTPGNNNMSETREFTVGPAPDSCIPPESGNWNVSGGDNCEIEENINVSGNLTITGSCNFTISSNITFILPNSFVFLGPEPCRIDIVSGGFNAG